MTNLIEAAVAPIKTDALDRAEQDTREYLAGLIADLVTNDMNLTITAPRPRSTMERGAYQAASAKLSIFHQITETISQASPREPNAPTIVKVRMDGIEKLVSKAREEAGVQYDAFVAKLVQKVGPVVSATLNGNHVWGYSTLTVEKADGTVENWKTQQIVNVSKLGNLFNQWPTRKVK